MRSWDLLSAPSITRALGEPSKTTDNLSIVLVTPSPQPTLPGLRQASLGQIIQDEGPKIDKVGLHSAAFLGLRYLEMTRDRGMVTRGWPALIVLQDCRPRPVFRNTAGRRKGSLVKFFVLSQV